MITSFSPLAKQPSMTGIEPVTWNSGTIRMNDGVGRAPGASADRLPQPVDGGAAGCSRGAPG